MKQTILGLLFVPDGMEDAAAEEVAEILPGSQPKCERRVVLFEAKDRLDLVKVAYTSLCSIRVLELIEQSAAEDLLSQKAMQHAASFLQENTTWALRCKIEDNDHMRQDMERELGGSLDDEFKKTLQQCKVQLSQPQVLFLAVIVENKKYFGVDYCGVDLSKREYKIFSSGNTLSGVTAAGFLRSSGVSKNDIVLDPFSFDGTIPIELALMRTRTSAWQYKKDALQCTQVPFLNQKDVRECMEKIDAESQQRDGGKIIGYGGLLRHLSTCQKNAKIAGVDRYVHFSKVTIIDVDLKLEEDSIDKIVTMPPDSTVEFNEKKLRQHYHELFYQAAYILRKQGIVATIGGKYTMLSEYAKNHNFELKEEKIIHQGRMPLRVMIFSKSEKKPEKNSA